MQFSPILCRKYAKIICTHLRLSLLSATHYLHRNLFFISLSPKSQPWPNNKSIWRAFYMGRTIAKHIGYTTFSNLYNVSIWLKAWLLSGLIAWERNYPEEMTTTRSFSEAVFPPKRWRNKMPCAICLARDQIFPKLLGPNIFKKTYLPEGYCYNNNRGGSPT